MRDDYISITPTVSGNGVFTLGYTSIGNDGLFVAGSCTTFSYENSSNMKVPPKNLMNPIGGAGSAYKQCLSACNGDKVIVNMDIFHSKIVFNGTISGTGKEEHGETVIGNEGATILGCGNKGGYENTFNEQGRKAVVHPGETEGEAG